jgi:hypothetical protein
MYDMRASVEAQMPQGWHAKLSIPACETTRHLSVVEHAPEKQAVPGIQEKPKCDRWANLLAFSATAYWPPRTQLATWSCT